MSGKIAAACRGVLSRLPRLRGARVFLLSWPRQAARLARRRRYRGAVAGLAICAVVATLLTTTLRQRDDTQRADQALLGERLLSAALRTAETDPPLSARLALAADTLSPSPRTTDVVLSSLLAAGGLTRVLDGQLTDLRGVAMTRVGSTLFGVATSTSGRVQLWNLDTGRRTADVAHAHRSVVHAIAVNPQLPDSLVTAGADGLVAFWRIGPEGQLTQDSYCCSGEQEITAEVTAVTFSRDGSVVAAGLASGSLLLIDTGGRRVVAELHPVAEDGAPLADTATRLISGLAFNDTREALYVSVADESFDGAAQDDEVGSGFVYRLDLSDGHNPNLARQLPVGQHGAVSALTYTAARWPLPERLLIGTATGAQAWDLATGREAAPFPLGGTRASIDSVGVGYGFVAYGSDKGTLIFTGEDLAPAGAPRRGVAAAATAEDPDNHLVTATRSGDLYQWDINGESPVATDSATGANLAAAGYTADARLLGLHENGALSWTRVDSGSTGSGDRVATVKARRPRTLAVSPPVPGAPEGLAAVGDWEVPGSGPAVSVVDIATGKLADAGYLDAHTTTCGGVRGLAFAPDGTTLLVGCGDGTVTAWDVRTWQRTATASLDSRVQAMTVSADGAAIVVGTLPSTVGAQDEDGELHFLKPGDLQPAGPKAAAHPGGVLTVAAGPDLLYTGGADGHVRSWTPDGRPTGQDRSLGGLVSALASDRDGRNIVAGTADGGVRLLDPTSLADIGTPLTPGSSMVVTAGVSPDGREAAAVMDDGSLARLSLDRAEWVRRLCLASGDLSDAEWDRYGAADRDPPRVCAGRSPATATTEPAAAPADPLTAAGLVTLTGSEQAEAAVAASTGTCADLDQGGRARCAQYGSGYAWTVLTERVKPEIEQTDSTLTVYRRDGTRWLPLLRTAHPSNSNSIEVGPVSTAGGDAMIAVLASVGRTSGGALLGVIDDGKVVFGASFSSTTMSAAPGGLRLVSAHHLWADPSCCPSGRVSRLLVRQTDGRWSFREETALPKRRWSFESW